MRNQTREDVVAEFHKAMGQAIGEDFTADLLRLRGRLNNEESVELFEVIDQAIFEVVSYGDVSTETKADLLGEMADLQYVLSGLAVTFGLPLQEGFMRKHNNNMSKLGDDGKPIYREDGKVMKPEGYVPADLSDLVQ